MIGRGLLAAAVTAGIVLCAPPASAHNVLTGSSPRDGARLEKAPERVTLTFNEPVRHGYDTIAVTGPGGGRYDGGRTTVSGRTVRAAMRPAGPAGRYTIGYRILSADGHPVTGELHFTLTAPGTGAPAPTVSALGKQNGGTDLTWLWIATGTVLAVLAAVLLLRRARHRRP